MVLKHVAADRIADGKGFGDLAVVSKGWGIELREAVKQGMQPWQPCWKAYLGVTPANEQVYRTFFSGILECRRDVNDKDPAYVLPLLPLMNLSTRTLDLPADITASKYLIITDHVQRFFQIGGDKDHILFATKAMIAIRMKSLNMSVELKAKLDEIMTQWDESIAPIGIFWRYSYSKDLTWFSYLITQDFPSISSCNLFENWQASRRGCGRASWDVMFLTHVFHVCFEPKIAL